MAKVSFYQVHIGEVTKVACFLLEKCYKAGYKTIVHVNDNDIMVELDKALWTFSQKAFIPHATTNDPLLERQPIILTTETQIDFAASTLMLLGPLPINYQKYERVFIIINGNSNEELEAAKHLFSLVPSNYTTEYYQQTTSGGWAIKQI